MYFIDAKKMNSVIDIKAGAYTQDGLYEFFLSHKTEVVYFVEGEFMKGVISIGDLERSLKNKDGELPINNNFFFVQYRNSYSKARKFFKEHPTVNEIPCVSPKGKFQGIIKYEKDEKIREVQRKGLERAYKLQWHQGEILRFIKCSRAKVFLCSMDKKKADANLTVRDRKIMNDRLKRKAENENPGLTEDEWKVFWGKDWYLGVNDDFRMESSKLGIKNTKGGYRPEDFDGKIFTFRDGARRTPGHDCRKMSSGNIYMYGPCIVVGAYCKDEQTVASHLQEILNQEDIHWNVLNRGVCVQTDCINRAFMESFSKDDIVIIIMEKEWLPANYYVENGIDFTDVFMDDNVCRNIVDAYFHCNGEMNRKIAEKIFEVLNGKGIFHCRQTRDAAVPIQDYYISWDMNHYFRKYFIEHKLFADDKKTTGAIVMNCNPFTLGHRYIIERALEYADQLYVFVVEEDRSYFSFKDRFEMVKKGVEDLEHVTVVPSGKYILSYDTFSQYFKKEQVKTVESMDYDIYIFAEVVVKRFNIKYRFVGEEPFDVVTKEYNNTMKRILPQFGVEVVEFPRKIDKEKKVINATDVRDFIAGKKYGRLKDLVPESTIQYLTTNGYI